MPVLLLVFILGQAKMSKALTGIGLTLMFVLTVAFVCKSAQWKEPLSPQNGQICRKPLFRNAPGYDR
jgi:hypothetical protein